MREGWQFSRLADVAEILMGQSPKGSSYNTIGEGVPLINGPVEFGDEAYSRTKTTKFTTQPTKMCREGDLILCIRGSTTGRMNIASCDSCIGRGVAAIRSSIYQDWINAFVNANRETIFRLGSGATFPNVSAKTLGDIPIPLPPLPEQERIVAALDEALAAIATATANAEKNLANARGLFESQLNVVFERGRKDWITARFGDLCGFVRGPFGGSLKKSCFAESGFAVYEQQHAINDQFDEVRYFIDERKFSEMARFELRPGDLIMSCSGTMGRVAIAPQNLRKGIINQALLKLTPGSDLLGKFLQIWMQSESFQQQLSVHSKGVAIKNVASVKVLKEIVAPLPTIEDQHTTVDKLHELQSAAHELHLVLLRKLTLLTELKQSILHKAFTGELTADQHSADRILEEASI